MNAGLDARFTVPDTASPEAVAGLDQMYGFLRMQPDEPLPKSQKDWDHRAAAVEAGMGPLAAMHADALGVTVTEDCLGDVPILRVRPKGWSPNNRTIVHIHGGGYVVFSARSALSVAALMAQASGTEIVSIDYTLAPRGSWQSIGSEILSVWRALLDAGTVPSSTGMMGDSAGAALAAGTTLRMRDEGVPLPGALFLNSPWSDITTSGDTYATLAPFDPILSVENLSASALAYAEPEDHSHPYVSPVHGDFAGVFPPTLIQGGTRDMFLSNCVRLYQAIRGGGNEAVLDLYEGMPHVFQPLVIQAPETRTSIDRAARFFEQHLR